jgi:hypothetical protein
MERKTYPMPLSTRESDEVFQKMCYGERVPMLGDFRHMLTTGATFNYVGYYADGKPQSDLYFDDPGRWEVERVVERGIVVSHPSGGHQHLMEWDKPLVKLKFGRPNYPKL